MSKHTPGPWTVTDEDDFYGLAIEAAGREGEYVPVARVPVDYDDRPEREANARLMAAAPDLLEALKALLSGSERHIFSTECKTERDAARTAIAKAEGRS